jgi:hypothetical protein
MSEPERSVLIALGKYLLSTEDLAYTIGKTQSETESIVQSLWAKGYVDRLDSPMRFILFPGLRGQSYKSKKVDSEIFLTLTSKGYFHLNPIFKKGDFYGW